MFDFFFFFLKKESLETGQMTFILARLEALEICRQETEAKAKALTEQVIPVTVLER